jgi:hypothetical protein
MLHREPWYEVIRGMYFHQVPGALHTLPEQTTFAIQLTFVRICEKFTPNSSNKGGSPSYPSVPNAASQPVRKPPCSPILPLTPAAGDPKPP